MPFEIEYDCLAGDQNSLFLIVAQEVPCQYCQSMPSAVFFYVQLGAFFSEILPFFLEIFQTTEAFQSLVISALSVNTFQFKHIYL